MIRPWRRRRHGFFGDARDPDDRPAARAASLVRLAVTGLAVAALLMAGCGATATVAPSVAGSASVGPSAAGSTGSAAAGSGSAAPSTSIDPRFPHDDPGLEDRLPDEVDGQPLTKFSVGPISAAGNVGAEPVRTLVKQIGDGSGNFGLAYASDPKLPTFNLFALRVPGASSEDLINGYTGLTVAEEPSSTTDRVTLAGKSVTQVIAPSNPLGDVWFYALDDTLFGVQAGSPEMAAKLLALLP
ncbi:MAG TPA: hypothetical protein VGQ64_02510 [Candidatus Limnocylindrales bacterium]|jgi:hypothetical protein|nr:hypothetical protein [Candidatus Limnocylindrales bacterium]